MNHPAPTTKTRHGFTLLELSIALGIIGLLVGGIVGFRGYVKNAAVSTMMNESKLLISAFQQFQIQYNNPPGDYCSTDTVCGTQASPTANNAWSGASNGDSNGLIRAGGTAFQLEQYYAFQHLAFAGFIQGRYTGAANGTGGATIGTNIQGSSMDKVAFIFDHPDETSGFVVNATTPNATYFDGQYGNILRIAGLNDNATTVPDQVFLTGDQALAIDLKYDDGMPGTGTIVTPKSSALSGCASNDNPILNSPTAATAAATYVTTTEAKTCYLFVRM